MSLEGLMRQFSFGPDLIRDGQNGGVFPVGNVAALTRMLERWCQDANAREQAGRCSLEIISKWDFDACCAGLQEALKTLSVHHD